MTHKANYHTTHREDKGVLESFTWKEGTLLGGGKCGPTPLIPPVLTEACSAFHSEP